MPSKCNFEKIVFETKLEMATLINDIWGDDIDTTQVIEERILKLLEALVAIRILDCLHFFVEVRVGAQRTLSCTTLCASEPASCLRAK